MKRYLLLIGAGVIIAAMIFMITACPSTKKDGVSSDAASKVYVAP